MVASFSVSLTLTFVVQGWNLISVGCTHSYFCYPLGDYFVLDFLGYVMCCTTLFVWVGAILFFSDSCGIFFITVSSFSSLLCFTSSNYIVFWFFYELSILSLLIKLYLNSPYSERVLACWYFCGYILFTSFPLFLSLVYYSEISGTFSFYPACSVNVSVDFIVCVVLISLGFVSKIPLFPFHSWLPIVHAEAPSIISVCLSGYIMKLGLYGLYRLCGNMIPYFIFSYGYVFLVIFFGLLFLFAASLELDSKRWVAYLSLAHMVISALGMMVCSYNCYTFPIFNCLGHGLVSSCSFIYLWSLDSFSGSRNWFILKSSCYNINVFVLVGFICLLAESSLPPVIGFIVELVTMGCSLSHFLLLTILLLYVFFCGLIPILFFVILVSFGYIGFGSSGFYNFFFFLVWTFLSIYLFPLIIFIGF